MGTTTFFLRLNDCGKPLHKMSKKELAELNNVTPYDDKPYKGGWLAPLELHNGNVNVLVFWKGRLMKIEDANCKACLQMDKQAKPEEKL